MTRNDFFPVACAILGLAPTTAQMERLTLDDGDPHYIESSDTYPVLDEDFDQ